MVATFPGTIRVAEPQISAMAAARGLDVEILSTVAPAPRVDVVCLAQFSMARARPEIQRQVSVPVLTSPTAAVQRLRALLG